MKYLVIKHNYKNKTTVVDKIFHSIHNATNCLEEQVYSFVTQIIGENFKIHERHHLNSRYWNTANYSYNIMRNTDESLYKLSVLFKKRIKGMFYETHEMIPIFYYEIVRLPDKLLLSNKTIIYYDEQLECDFFEHKAKMDKVLDNIENRTIKENDFNLN